MVTKTEIEKAEQIIKGLLREHGQCNLSVDECIWLFHKTGSWDAKRWEGYVVPEGIGGI